MRYFILIITVLFLLIGLTNTYAQITFDVKTQMSEKQDLQNYKQGLLSAISKSGWARELETGEDYSLWLNDLNRSYQADSVIVTIIVQLRTKAMFTNGEFIDARQVWLKYHWDNAEKYASKELLNYDFDSENHSSFDETIYNLSSAAGLVTSIGFVDVTGLSDKGVQSLITGIASVLKREPSPLEILESLYLGEQSLFAAKDMVQQAPN